MRVNHRTLGRTGVEVSEIGFGCGPTAGLMVTGTREAQLLALTRALDAGVSHFDTAPTYGEGVSERNLGQCLAVLGVKPVVATKVALQIGDLDDAAAAVERSVEASLARLGMPFVTVVHLHNRVGRERSASGPGTGAVLTVDDVLGRGGVADGFQRVHRRGLARVFGCTAFGGDMGAVGDLVDSGAFDVLAVHYSLLNPTGWSPAPPGSDVSDYGGIGARAARAGLGTVALRVLEGGALAGEAETAVRFALSNPEVSVVVVGFSDATQVADAARWSASGPLPDALLERILHGAYRL
ncbi:MAG: aldo/keto reductase [Acidimicrobiia bacterium]